MSTHYHAVVWIDHHHPLIVHFSLEAAEVQTRQAPHARLHPRAKAGSPSGTHLRGEDAYDRGVAEALASAHEVLITGPSSTKRELVQYLRKHQPQLLAHVHAVEVDKTTDAELVAAARRRFKTAERMKP